MKAAVLGLVPAPTCSHHSNDSHSGTYFHITIECWSELSDDCFLYLGEWYKGGYESKEAFWK